MLTNYQLSLDGATWIDSNSKFGLNNLPDRLADAYAIQNSLFNLFNCPIGARGRIFEPTYGSQWMYFLQEPIDDQTAASMRIGMIQAIAKWEPRLQLDYGNTYIAADYNLPGYQVQISGIITLTKVPLQINFAEQL